MKPPSKEDMDHFLTQLSKISEELEPKMRDSRFVLMPFAPSVQTDAFLALQIGMSLLLEKPLIIVALEDVYAPPRLMAVADAVVRGASLEETKVELAKVVNRIARTTRPQ